MSHDQGAGTKVGWLSRRRFILGCAALTGLGLLTGCGAVPPQVQPPPKVPRVGLLLFYSDTSAPQPQAFFQGMRELGYVDGQSVVYEHRSAEESSERLPILMAELLNSNVDLIWTLAIFIAGGLLLFG